MKIKALQDTYLKKSTTNASKLPDSEKVPVALGVSYDVDEHTIIDGEHDIVELSYGSGTWHIYEPHWELDWERIEDDDKHDPIGLENTVNVDLSDPNLWKNNANRISKYFTVGEAINYDSRRIPARGSTVEKNIFALAKELDKLREHFGVPLKCNSWNRPPAINRAVGGVNNSKHTLGLAVDITVTNGDYNKLKEIEDYCVKHWKGGVGRAALNPRKRFCHLDSRNGFPCFNQGPATAIWYY